MENEQIGPKILQHMMEEGPLFGWEWVAEEILQQPQFALRNLVVGVTGRREVEGTMVTLMICLTEHFPKEIPIIYLVPPNALGLLPHIDPDGFICYISEEGLIPNHRDPERVMRGAMNGAVKVLEDGMRGENYADFINDLEYFWKRYQGAINTTFSLVSPGPKPKRLLMVKDNNDRVFIAGSTSDISKYENEKTDGKWKKFSAIYLPLRPDTTFQLPEYGTFWTPDEARKNIMDNVVPNSEKFLERIKRKGCFKPTETVVLGVPRPSGGTAIVGIRFHGVKKRHPLSRLSEVERLEPMTFIRLDPEYLLPRGGADIDLGSKRIALIGCGSVGGYIATSLVTAGLRNLILIDGEKLNPENIFRHVLGRHGLDGYKSDSLKKELTIKFPYIKVKSIPTTIQEAIDSGKFKWNTYDLVIVAVGRATVELHLNEVAVRSPDTPPVLFTWLEPYNIGGHVVLVNNGGGPGCLECLFTPSTPRDPDLGNKIHFSLPGQIFGKDISGCGQLFTPYGSLSALRTAEMATRMAVDTLTGHVVGNPLVSWKGDSRAFQEAGFKLSENHKKSHDELLNPSYDHTVDQCPTCGSELEVGRTP